MSDGVEPSKMLNVGVQRGSRAYTIQRSKRKEGKEKGKRRRKRRKQ